MPVVRQRGMPVHPSTHRRTVILLVSQSPCPAQPLRSPLEELLRVLAGLDCDRGVAGARLRVEVDRLQLPGHADGALLIVCVVVAEPLDEHRLAVVHAVGRVQGIQVLQDLLVRLRRAPGEVQRGARGVLVGPPQARPRALRGALREGRGVSQEELARLGVQRRPCAARKVLAPQQRALEVRQSKGGVVAAGTPLWEECTEVNPAGGGVDQGVEELGEEAELRRRLRVVLRQLEPEPEHAAAVEALAGEDRAVPGQQGLERGHDVDPRRDEILQPLVLQEYRELLQELVDLLFLLLLGHVEQEGILIGFFGLSCTEPASEAVQLVHGGSDRLAAEVRIRGVQARGGSGRTSGP
mmetsp:Transcript_10945/g.33917  ORF Transcript_10945/g.33917 Transcript_10945/m.33917 type:complete len:353 (-) Transcript_10945:7-1065(-)